MKKVCVIGMWHLGCVTAGCLSKLGNEVICYDYDDKIISNLNDGNFPIYEKGLDLIFQESKLNKKLFFSDNIKQSVSESEIIYVTFDTKIDNEDKIDLSIINNTIDDIIHYIQPESIIIISSQIPVGTSNIILQKIRNNHKFNEVCYIPENLRLGNAIDAFMNPERIIVGVSSEDIKLDIEELFSGIDTKFLFMSLKSAEMVKHSLNSYLATMISFSGEISNICENVGANALDVMNALKTEKRVSPYAPLMPGLGFGGGTLARDIQILRDIGIKNDIKTVVLDSVLLFNIDRMNYIKNKILFIFNNNLKNKKITFLGLTYKVGTNTLRRSLTLQVIDQLKNENIKISAYDPMINKKIEEYEFIDICNNVNEAIIDSDAIIIMNEYEEFKNLDFNNIINKMKTPIIIDTKNVIDSKKISSPEIKYYGVGC